MLLETNPQKWSVQSSKNKNKKSFVFHFLSLVLLRCLFVSLCFEIVYFVCALSVSELDLTLMNLRLDGTGNFS